MSLFLSYRNNIRSEIIIVFRSYLKYFLICGPVFDSLEIFLLNLMHWDFSLRSLLSAQNLWALFVLPVIAIILAILDAKLHVDNRFGGLQFRKNNIYAQRVARFSVLCVLMASINFLAYIIPVIQGFLGHNQSIPLLFSFAKLWIFSTLGQFLLLACISWLTYGFNASIAVSFSVIWFYSILKFTEKSLWWLFPSDWYSHAILPVIGTHFNGYRLEPRSDIWHYPVFLPIIGSALLSLAITIVEISKKLGNFSLRRQKLLLRKTGLKSPLYVVISLLSSKYMFLTMIIGEFVLLYLIRTYPPYYVLEIFGSLALPLCAIFVSIYSWVSTHSGLDLLLLREKGRKIPLWLLAINIILPAVCSCVYWLIIEPKMMPYLMPYVWISLLLGIGVGALIAAFSLMLLAITQSIGLCLLVNVIGFIFGVLISGNQNFRHSLWYLSPWSWAYSLAYTYQQIFIIAAVCIIGTILCGRIYLQKTMRTI